MTLILDEQRAQRIDLAQIARKLKFIGNLLTENSIQTEIEDYHDTSDNESTPDRSADTVRHSKEL